MDQIAHFSQVPVGPKTSTVIEPSGIEGALLMSVPNVEYEYGNLAEIFNMEWDSIYREPVEHMYMIRNRPNTREEWHVHTKTVDRYVLLQGVLEVALFDGRDGGESAQKLVQFELNSLGDSGPNALRIPPGVWHTFRSAGEFALLNCKYPGFNRENPDKYVATFPESGIDFKWN
jgi:dTDP-4-dehydrorhamnose 3,5-epimerase-like enzyme